MRERIKEIRKMNGLTQTEFGARIGVKGNTITGYENGLRTPSDAVILSICREFDINEEWLRAGTGRAKKELTREQEIASFIGRLLADDSDDIKKRFIAMLSELSENGWAAIAEMAEKMTKD